MIMEGNLIQEYSQICNYNLSNHHNSSKVSVDVNLKILRWNLDHLNLLQQRVLYHKSKKIKKLKNLPPPQPRTKEKQKTYY